MEEMNELSKEAIHDPYTNRDKLNNLKQEYNKERNQEQFEYNVERVKGGNMVDIAKYQDMQNLYRDYKNKFENIEKELKDLEEQYNKLTTYHHDEISNVYMKAVEKARNWMLFFMGTTIGCLGYIGYLVLFAEK